MCCYPMNKLTQSRFTIAFIVYLALLIDNILLTVIVPILPEFLMKIQSVPTSSVLPTSILYKNFDLHYVPNILIKHPIPKTIMNFTLISTTNSHHNYTNNEITDNSIISTKLSTLNNENGTIGLLLAIKALVQLICNPLVGSISTKFGYRLPIFCGTFCLLISSIVFAAGETYATLLIGRGLQGIGSACIGVCGMSLVAQLYPEDEKRSKVMGIILGSIALGVLLGYPFGGILYDFIGKSAPFIIIAIIIFIILVLQFLYIDLRIQPEINIDNEKPKWKYLLKNHMIIAIVIGILLSTSTMAILEPCLPIWLLENLQAKKWQLGTVFIPDSIGYFVGTNFFGMIAYKYGQIKISCLSLLLVGISSILIPSATTVYRLLLPHFGLGLGIGIVDAALVPLLASFVDASLQNNQNNHDADNDNDNDSTTTNYNENMSSYGTVYAIQQTSVSLAYSLAPLIGGELAETIGFPWLMRIIGIINLIYSPILFNYYTKNYNIPSNENTNQILLSNCDNNERGGGTSNYKRLYNSVE